jgi:SAM-dependent methyltransferase
MYERVRSGRTSVVEYVDGLALPPADLRFRVAGTGNPVAFVQGGQRAVKTVIQLLPNLQGDVLDFGCGCGRVLRQWENAGVRLHGIDPDAAAMAWCRANLPFVRVERNASHPPVPFATEAFDLIYAFSVFTHMTEDLQRAWLAEFQRLLKPEGNLIFSTHGAYYLSKLTARERFRFRNGEMVVRFSAAAGSNLCNTYHPEAFVRRMVKGWQVAAFVPEGALGNPRQDVWLLGRNEVKSPPSPEIAIQYL